MRFLLLTLLFVLVAPGALAQKPGGKPAASAAAVTISPFAGTWDYAVTTPDGDEETGTFTIREEGDHLGGIFVTDTTSPIDPFVMTGDAAAFTFKHPQMGVIAIRGTLAGDRFEGEAEVTDEEMILPFVATRQAEAAAADR
jgi:hypothetical protein